MPSVKGWKLGLELLNFQFPYPLTDGKQFFLSLKMLDTLPLLESGAHLALLALQDHQVSLELVSCPMLT